jgi:hypothetical protein
MTAKGWSRKFEEPIIIPPRGQRGKPLWAVLFQSHGPMPGHIASLCASCFATIALPAPGTISFIGYPEILIGAGWRPALG